MNGQRWQRRYGAVSATLGTAAALASCGSPPDYVGEVGTMVDADGAMTVFVHTCGHDIDEVTVAADGDTIAPFVPDVPFSGAQSFALGGPAPSGWDASAETKTVPQDPDSAATITVDVTMHSPGTDVEFRSGEATMAGLTDQKDRIVMGTPHKSGDQSLTDPPEWDDACSHGRHSPEIKGADE
ncbi:MAG TPA: hypothetical protein H9870_09685 [Candidatus Corynebacterium avicola]|uniref:Uncharacterized protein n=1 Tax=Candidatus Corynebacterium avicola TaxID=2838527 RepID=A0A9D1ULA0_9CORY|nr:hypothetical protein [Candidatus Corynebacterium avicola]